MTPSVVPDVAGSVGSCGHTAVVALSDREQRWLATLRRDLAEVERTDEVTGEALATAVEEANIRRAAAGLPSLDVDPPPPEEELYRRARALGLRRIRR